MFVRRSSDRSGDHLDWRVRLFGAAAILAVFGIGAELRWMVWVAIAVLGSAVALRFIPGVNSAAAPDSDEIETD